MREERERRKRDRKREREVFRKHLLGEWIDEQIMEKLIIFHIMA